MTALQPAPVPPQAVSSNSPQAKQPSPSPAKAYKPVAPLEEFRNALHLQTCYPDSDSVPVELLVVSVRLGGNVRFVLVFGLVVGKRIEIGMIECSGFRVKLGIEAEVEVETGVEYEGEVGQEDMIGLESEVVGGQTV